MMPGKMDTKTIKSIQLALPMSAFGKHSQFTARKQSSILAKQFLPNSHASAIPFFVIVLHTDGTQTSCQQAEVMHCLMYCMCSKLMKTIRHHVALTVNSDSNESDCVWKVILRYFTYQLFLSCSMFQGKIVWNLWLPTTAQLWCELTSSPQQFQNSFIIVTSVCLMTGVWSRNCFYFVPKFIYCMRIFRQEIKPYEFWLLLTCMCWDLEGQAS